MRIKTGNHAKPFCSRVAQTPVQVAIGAGVAHSHSQGALRALGKALCTRLSPMTEQIVGLGSRGKDQGQF